ncbi:O-acyltransferase, WSD1, N-terminal [Artemisia annua]|uniref:diacylglycerol O-acyltransferase n=1 Tax=Artemisia annua TaxID=35608 RepID=A0A2U1QMS1_ARTAN|nr:O-acyltransferase, WSD1, N-terminal [Artemisia annua]
MSFNDDEPLTPAGRLFTQPATHQIINCALGLDRPIEYDAVRTVVSNSLMIKHPRFTSLLVKDNNDHEYWRKIDLDIDQHIIMHNDPVVQDYDTDESAINEYLADLSVSSPLCTDKPLWEIHILSVHKRIVVRIHHALGDGISLMSLMLTLCRKLDKPDEVPTIEPLVSSSTARSGILFKVVTLLKMIWYTLVYMIHFILRITVVDDGQTMVLTQDLERVAEFAGEQQTQTGCLQIVCFGETAIRTKLANGLLLLQTLCSAAQIVRYDGLTERLFTKNCYPDNVRDDDEL